MKTKRQIEHFLARKKYKSEMDFEGISLYCKTKFNIRLHRPSNYYPEPTDDIQPLDYATFADWLEHGYGAGDVVEWDENIGLVQDGGIKEVRICLKIDRSSLIFDSFVLDGQLIHPAQENAVERIYEALDANGKEFGNPFFCITDKYIPNPNTIVTFQNHKTGESGVGVVRLITQSGDITMYCWYVKSEPVRYSMNEKLGNIIDYSFQSVQPADYPRKALDVALAKVGKTWNHFLRRIEPLKMKVEEGSQYYYINDKRAVVCDTEKGTPTSHKRYIAGNYFRRQEDALRILEAENEIRRNFLAEPEKD
jgi:hypothetical protein|uniref:Uncharacterized protein n=1 Tax=Siphoviridae sp. ctAUQ2 TaxID=2826182 RepID=A0A8S5MZ20_9CAUD|nr:MAG TPA: hypothetical protein [Siphoviridae sp. ctAUQ2]